MTWDFWEVVQNGEEPKEAWWEWNGWRFKKSVSSRKPEVPTGRINGNKMKGSCVPDSLKPNSSKPDVAPPTWSWAVVLLFLERIAFLYFGWTSWAILEGTGNVFWPQSRERTGGFYVRNNVKSAGHYCKINSFGPYETLSGFILCERLTDSTLSC